MTIIEQRLKDRDWDECLIYHALGKQPQMLHKDDEFIVSGDGYVKQTVKDATLPSAAPRSEQEFADMQSGKIKVPGANAEVYIDVQNAQRVEFFKRVHIKTPTMIVKP